MDRSRERTLAFTSILVGLIVSAGLLLAILDVNLLPLLSRDSAILLAGALIIVGLPVAIAFAAIGACLGALLRRRGASAAMVSLAHHFLPLFSIILFQILILFHLMPRCQAHR